MYQLVFLVDFEENPVKSNRACSRSLHSLSMIFDKFKGCSDKRHCRLPYRTITMVHWCVQNLSTPALILKSIHQIRLLIELIELGSSLFFFFLLFVMLRYAKECFCAKNRRGEYLMMKKFFCYFSFITDFYLLHCRQLRSAQSQVNQQVSLWIIFNEEKSIFFTRRILWTRFRKLKKNLL